MKTEPGCRQQTAEQMAASGYTPSAIHGTLHIRSLDDQVVLAVARGEDATSHAAIAALIGSDDDRPVNPIWVTSRCAEEAYERGLIGEQELDWITR